MNYKGKEIRRNPLVITGSSSTTHLKVEQAASGSTAIYTNNITNGWPTSNPWGESLDGSYFNNFDNTTHVSEVLRFMSGVLSHSLDVSDAAPNIATSSTWAASAALNPFILGVSAE